MSATEVPNDNAGVSRRSMLQGGVGLAITGSLAHLFGTGEAEAHGKHGPGHGKPPRQPGYGPLVPDPKGRLSLPEGFTYTIVAEAGVTKLETGEPTPGAMDGTASFQRRGGGTVLINNHEQDDEADFPVPHLEGFTYDDQMLGGTTNIEVDRFGRRVNEYVSLAGTATNCAGGRSPWETWLTCEETESPAGKPHGYVFEVCPWDRDYNRDPQPIKCLGRFAHESVAVDPRRGTIYLTEDASNPNGLLYRWTPPRSCLPLQKGSLKELPDTAGSFEALQAYTPRGQFVPDLSAYSQPGTTLRTKWVAVPDREASTLSTRKQLQEVTRSRKLEGMWWGDDGAYFVASYARTSDGSVAQHDGQVWFIDPDERTLELKLHFAYTPDDQDNDPDGPDNITVSAYGGLIIAEDGAGQQHLVGADEDGKAFFFARNELIDENSEFTGPTFSRDKRFLFANVQTPGTVFAIQGPFRRQRR